MDDPGGDCFTQNNSTEIGTDSITYRKGTGSSLSSIIRV